MGEIKKIYEIQKQKNAKNNHKWASAWIINELGNKINITQQKYILINNNTHNTNK